MLLCHSQFVVHPAPSEIPNGRPLDTRAIPARFQLPITASTRWFTLPPKCCPCPNGISHTQSAVSRCAVSKSDTASFLRGFHASRIMPKFAAFPFARNTFVGLLSESEPKSSDFEYV